MKITLKEWALRNGIKPDTARQMANRGTLRTAKRMGRDWMVDENEKRIDRRRKMEGLTLMEITGQESGIVVYDDKIIVTNWCTYEPGYLPVMSPFNTVMPWPGDVLKVEEEWYVDDVRKALPGQIVESGENEIEANGMEIMYDYHGDIPALWGYDTGLGACIDTDDSGSLIPTAGTCYRIGDAVVIAPDGWN